MPKTLSKLVRGWVYKVLRKNFRISMEKTQGITIDIQSVPDRTPCSWNNLNYTHTIEKMSIKSFVHF